MFVNIVSLSPYLSTHVDHCIEENIACIVYIQHTYNTRDSEFCFHVFCDHIGWLEAIRVALVDAVCLEICVTRSFIWLSKPAFFYF